MPTLVPKGLKNWWQRTFTRKRKRTIKEAEAAKKTAYRISRNTRGTLKNVKPISKSLAKVLPPSSVVYKLGTEKPTLYQRFVGKVKGLNKPPTSAPLQEPSSSYPMFKGNTRRDVRIDPETLNDLKQKNKNDTQKLVTKGSYTLPIESLYYGKRRLYKYFLDKHIGAIREPLVGVYRQYAKNTELHQLFTKLKQFLRSHQSLANLESLSEIVARDFFHTNLEALDREIKIAEGVNQIVMNPSRRIEFAQEYGSELNRYLLGMTQTPRKFKYEADLGDYFCGLDGEEKPPVLDFTAPLCICCFMNSNHFFRYIHEGGKDEQEKKQRRENRLKGCSNYIILNPEHFPSAYAYERTTNPVSIKANKFLETSFIQDAFREQGVDTMDEDLYTLIRSNPEGKELYKESRLVLWNASTFDKKLKYEPGFLSKTKNRYMVFKDEALPEKEVFVDKDPLTIAVVRKAMEQQRRFLFCDPYTAYCTKKKNQNAWNQAFGVQVGTGKYKNIAFDIYNELTEREKFFVDFFQYFFIFDTYMGESGAAPFEQRLEAASAVYREPLYSENFLDNVKLNSEVNQVPFKLFIEMQDDMFPYDERFFDPTTGKMEDAADPAAGKKIRKQEQVDALLEKLRTGVVTIPEGNNAYLQQWRTSRFAGTPRILEEEEGLPAAAAVLGGTPSSVASTASLESLARGPGFLPASPSGTSVRTRNSTPGLAVPNPPGYANSPGLSLPAGYEFPITPLGSPLSSPPPPPPPPAVNRRPALNVRPETLRIRIPRARNGLPVGTAGPVRSGSPGFGYNETRRARNAEKRAFLSLAQKVAPRLNASAQNALRRILTAPPSRAAFRNTGFGTGLVNQPLRNEEGRRRNLQSNLELRLNRLSGEGQPNIPARQQRIDLINLLMKSLKTGASLADIELLYNQLFK